MLADDDNDTSRPWRNSVQGFFRATSASPDRSLRTGTAHVATAVLGLGIQHNGLKSSFSSANSGSGGMVKLVRVNDFADSDTTDNSMYTDEEIQSAENIYNVVREYEDGQNFRFEEAFLSDSDSDKDNSVQEGFEGGHITEKTREMERNGEIEGGNERNLSNDVRDGSSGLAQRRMAPLLPLPLAETTETFSKLGFTPISLLEEPKIPSNDATFPNKGTNRAIGPLTPTDSTFSIFPPRTPTTPSYPEPNVTPYHPSVGKDDAYENSLGSVDIATSLDLESPEEAMEISEQPLESFREDMETSEHPIESFREAMETSEYPTEISEHPIDTDGAHNASTVHDMTELRNPESHSFASPDANTPFSGDNLKPLHGSNFISSRTLDLVAGVDSQSELPVMLYTIQDQDLSNNRWSVYESVYEKERRMEILQVPEPTYSGSRSGSNSPREVSFLSRSTDIPSSDSSRSEKNDTDLATASQGFSSHLSPKLGTTLKWRSPEALQNHEQPNEASHVLLNSMESPVSSVVQDTVTKQHHHEHMTSQFLCHEKKSLYRQISGSANDVPWAKWFSMMIMGLVAVPIYFMVAFGFFDYGGNHDYTLKRTLDEKDTNVGVRYFRRYTRTQKVLSGVIGILWMMVVVAMIGVGIGLGIRR